MAYDAVIIGAGHNGLAAGVHLAARGKRVAIVEAKEEPGGAVKTRELTLPGFRHDLCAMNFSMFAGSGFFAAHKDALLAHGLAFVPAEQSFASVFRDGTYLGVSRALETTLAGISALSPADAKAWADLLARFGGDAPHIFALLGSPMPSIAAARVVWKAWRAMGTNRLVDTVKLLLASPRDFLDARFEHPKVKTMMAAWGLHLDFSPDVAGGALFPYLESMANQSLGMVIGQGGADTIIKAMVGALKAEGGELILGDGASRIDLANGAASGVTLQSGEARSRNDYRQRSSEDRIRRADAARCDARIFPRGREELSRRPGHDDDPPRAGRSPRLARRKCAARIRLRSCRPRHGNDDFSSTPRRRPVFCPPSRCWSLASRRRSIPRARPRAKHVLWVQVRVLPAEIRGDAAGTIAARGWDEAREPYADRVLDIRDLRAGAEKPRARPGGLLAARSRAGRIRT